MSDRIKLKGGRLEHRYGTCAANFLFSHCCPLNTKMKAIKSVALGRAELVDNVPIPSLKDFPRYVLVKTRYSGVNPCDHQFTDIPMAFTANNTLGCEFNGVVVEAGPDVTKFKDGDRIAGYTFATHPPAPNAGTHAEYILVKGDAQLSVDALGDAVLEEQSAALGISLGTTYEAIYYYMKFPLPDPDRPQQAGSSKKLLLVYGGSTVTGMMMIQFAALSGVTVITTCSPKNFDLVKSLGASAAFDYRGATECASNVNEFVEQAGLGELELIVDCIGAFESPQICASALSSSGGTYLSVSPTPFPRQEESGVFPAFLQGQRPIGEEYRMAGHTIPANEELFEGGKKFMTLTERLFREGKLKAPAVEVIAGIEKIPDAMQELREWRVSAKKYVCKLE